MKPCDLVTTVAAAVLKPGSILGMRTAVAHVAECIGNVPTIGLHVYGGDIFELPRRMWRPETREQYPLDCAS